MAKSVRGPTSKLPLSAPKVEIAIAAEMIAPPVGPSNRLANALRARGFVKGDRLGCYLSNRVEWIDLYLGCVKLGVIFVPINILYRDREIAHIVSDAEPRAIIDEAALIEVLQQVLEGNVTVPLALQSVGQPVSHALPGGNSTASSNEPDVALLTLRQLEVLSRVCQGKTNKQIATELGLSEKTVKAHVTAIFKVLGVVNRTQAVLVSRRVGMITN